MEYIPSMDWIIEFDEDFSVWFESIELPVQNEILAALKVLRQLGPSLGRQRVDSVKGSRHSNMKELRVQCKGSPWRILFAFDPDRKAILLVGGDKTGDERFYKTNIPIADARFDKHLEELKEAKRKLKKEYGK